MVASAESLANLTVRPTQSAEEERCGRFILSCGFFGSGRIRVSGYFHASKLFGFLCAALAIILSLCFSAAAPSAYGQTNVQSQVFEVRPSSTDSRIQEFDDPHVCWLPTAGSRSQLLLFLPGTNGTPRIRFPLASTAASLGFHVISLMYPDTIAAQQSCPNSPDPNAYMKFRLAIIQGGQFESMIVTPPNSIESRLTRLLVYLSRNQQGRGWDQFIDASGQPDWSRIAVSGQSQGGGHAYVIAKIHPVARALMFGSPKDYSFYFRRPAVGFDSDTKTPLNRMFTFNHLLDTAGGVNYDMQMQILRQIRLTDQGMLQVDGPTNDFRHARVIYTNAVIPNQTSAIQYHGCVSSGLLNFDPIVWTYMLTEPVK